MYIKKNLKQMSYFRSLTTGQHSDLNSQKSVIMFYYEDTNENRFFFEGGIN